MTKTVTTPYGCTVWRVIRNLWPMLQVRTRVKVGNGQKTSIWHDKWAGHLTMKQQHPELFTLSQQQQATNGCGLDTWNLFLRRYLNDWEMGRIAEFYNYIVQS